MTTLMNLINKLYGNQRRSLDNITNVMGITSNNQNELSNIKKSGYYPVKAAEADSHRFSYDNLGYPQDAIVNAKRDIKDIKNSRTAHTSKDFQLAINFDKQQIKRDSQYPKNELVLISRLNNGQITRVAKPEDIEMIYHKTHYSTPEIVKRHSNLMTYMVHDAKLDAERDLN